MNNLLPILLGLTALIGSIVAPTLYVGGIKEQNAVQASEISTLQKNYERLEIKIDKQDEKLNMILVKLGGNPEKVSTK